MQTRSRCGWSRLEDVVWINWGHTYTHTDRDSEKGHPKG